MTFEIPDLRDTLVLLGSITAAFLLALPLGWERKSSSEAYVGLRVFPLVSVSACAFVILGEYLFGGTNAVEQSDVLQGLMTGIGFIGAGAIVKESDQAHGLATAAAVWATGAIGASIGYRFYVLALTLSATSLLILVLMPLIAPRAKRATRSARERRRARRAKRKSR